MSGDVLNVLTCLRVVCKETGGSGGCYQPQGAKMQIAPEDHLQTFRKRFCSPGTEPGQYAKDTRRTLYASCKSSPRHSPGTCRPPQLSPALLCIAVDLLRHMDVPFRSAALLLPQQSLLLLASGSFTTHSLPFVSSSTLLHQLWHSSQLLAGPPPDSGCPPCSSGHYRGVTNWTLSRATCESHSPQR